MKKLLLLTIMLFVFCSFARAQSDTLSVNLKDGSKVKIPVSQIKRIQFENLTSVNDQNTGSSLITIKGNRPNPFSSQTSIEFEISEPGNVYVLIFNNSGNLIQTLNCQDCQSGKNILTWDCLDKENRRVTAGTYYYEIRFKNESQTRKMIVIK